MSFLKTWSWSPRLLLCLNLLYFFKHKAEVIRFQQKFSSECSQNSSYRKMNESGVTHVSWLSQLSALFERLLWQRLTRVLKNVDKTKKTQTNRWNARILLLKSRSLSKFITPRVIERRNINEGLVQLQCGSLRYSHCCRSLSLSLWKSATSSPFSV